MCASLLKLAVNPISGKSRRPPYHGRTPFFWMASRQQFDFILLI
ncbi:hypothetical protein HMPREF3039_00039 [Akkermansia sp. KLE1798]|nr:hypothetical protein HMPREF3039_00039 [Akkermansia sp. KLE1798]